MLHQSTKDATKFGVKLFQGKQRILVNFILYKSVILLTQEFKNNSRRIVLMFVYITKIYFLQYIVQNFHFSPMLIY